MPAEPTPLVGRAEVLAAIGRRAREGTGAVLTGAPGSGGTRLLADAFTATRRAGLRAARVLPTATTGGGLEAFLPLLDPTVLEELRDTARETISASTMALGLDAIFLDDAHLLDEDAGSLLVDLARNGTAVVANATGPGELPTALRLLVDEGHVSPISLVPLTREEVAELAGHLLGDPVAGELALALAAASGGRPGTLTEIVEAGVATRAIVHSDGLWHLTGPLPVGRTIRTAVLDAFTRLPPEQRGWIAALAQAGVLADDLARRIAASDAIAAVLASGWTVRDATAPRTWIVSPAVAAAVLGTLDVRARLAVLRRLIAVAETTSRPLDDGERVALARWRIEAGQRPDPDEARELALLPSTDPAAREALLRAAVDGGAPADAELADHLRLTRRPAEALELIHDALPDAATLEERIALIRVRSMTRGIVERRPADALGALDAEPPECRAHPDLLAVRAAMQLLEARPADAAATAETVLAQPDRSTFATAFGLLQLALGRREVGDLEGATAAAALLAALDDVDRAFADGAAIARWLRWELPVAVGAETTEAEAAVGAAYDAVPPERFTVRRPPLSFTLATIRLQRGDPAAAGRLLREAEAGSGAWREGWLPRILAELAGAQALSGALEEAAATLDRLGRIACPPVLRGRVELAAAQVAHARGDADLARSLAAAAADRARAGGMALEAFDATFAGIRYGDEDAPTRLLELGDRPGGTGRAVQRALARALLAADADAVDVAALGLWDAGLRLFAIEGALRAAALGSVAASTRAVAWLARTPTLRLPGIGDRRSAGLTAREREVALLAARGSSDRAIAEALGITLRTAQTHLGRALAKLGIHRRTELRGLVVDP